MWKNKLTPESAYAGANGTLNAKSPEAGYWTNASAGHAGVAVLPNQATSFYNGSRAHNVPNFQHRVLRRPGSVAHANTGHPIVTEAVDCLPESTSSMVHRDPSRRKQNLILAACYAVIAVAGVLRVANQEHDAQTAYATMVPEARDIAAFRARSDVLQGKTVAIMFGKVATSAGDCLYNPIVTEQNGNNYTEEVTRTNPNDPSTVAAYSWTMLPAGVPANLRMVVAHWNDPTSSFVETRPHDSPLPIATRNSC